MSRIEQLRLLQARVAQELADEQRRLNLSPQRRAQRLIHGTDSGYYWHRNHRVPFPEDNGETPCGCRIAHAEAERRRAAERKAS